ncbi:DUF2958 domain-containing protein [Pseudarthrobacter sp. NIBRBAC000502770]|uniref:DUF2958 domain-containing protein n=1 Tax=Pseudarthrobacter sp. NIBRBAC000502770 TaxID=2590785 RepID=UPI001AF00B2D|nr:DUF2958 domain-containing protein [Pseudarthrobacter sp. NIBRBAC000502770]
MKSAAHGRHGHLESTPPGPPSGNVRPDRRPREGEWGYASLTEIEKLRGQFGLPIERELDFKPGTLAKECIPQYVAEEAERKAEAEANEASAAALAAAAATAGTAQAHEDDDDRDFDWPEDEGDPLSPEDREKWDSHHRWAYIGAIDLSVRKGLRTATRRSGSPASQPTSTWNQAGTE